MNCSFLELGKFGDKKFAVTRGLTGRTIGIVGLGRIGKRIAEMIKAFEPGEVSYSSKHRHIDAEKSLGIEHKTLESLLATSEIVFLCVSNDAGDNFFNEAKFDQMKNDALFVSFMHPGIVNEAGLLKHLKSGRIRAISDYPMSVKEFDSLPLSNWYSFVASNTNSEDKVKKVSNTAVISMLNVLAGNEDPYVVNKQ